MNGAALISLFLSYVSITQAARILGIFPFPGNSHFTCNNAILKSLANAGHEITVVTAFPEKTAKENYTSVLDVSEVKFIFVSQSAVEDFSTMTVRDMMYSSTILRIPQCKKVLNFKEIKNILNSKVKPFDVMLVEILLYERCYHWIATKFKIPVIGVITTRSWFAGDLEILNPRHPYIPIELSKNINLENFYGRLQKVLEYFEALGLYYWYNYAKDDLHQFYEKCVVGHTLLKNLWGVNHH